MIPQEIYCGICQEWTGKFVQMDSDKQPLLGEHDDIRECVRHLADRIRKLERTLSENGIYL